MKEFFIGMVKGFIYVFMGYFLLMLFLNLMLGVITDETIEIYKPVWNIFKLM